MEKNILVVIDKSDICEWKPIYPAHDNKIELVIKHSRYKRIYEVREWEYCPYCGKKAKISEVEHESDI